MSVVRSVLLVSWLSMPFVGSSCTAIATGVPESASADKGAAAEDAQADQKSDAAKARAKARKAAKREHELSLARVELEIAEIEVRSDELEANLKLEDARRELEEARRTLEHFRARKMPRELEDGRLDLDRATQSRTEAEQELKEMEETYAKDQFAKDTKELVLMRHRKRVEFSHRSFAIASAEFADRENVELPRQLRELEQKMRAAEIDVRDAEVALQKQQLKSKLELARKRWDVRELEEPDEDEESAPKKRS